MLKKQQPGEWIVRVSIQGFLVLGKQLIIYCEQGQAVDQSEKDDRVPLVPGVELGVSALLQKLLGFLQGGGKAEAQAQQPVAGGIAPPGKDLVQVNLAHAGLLGQACFGNIFAQIQQILSQLWQQNKRNCLA